MARESVKPLDSLFSRIEAEEESEQPEMLRQKTNKLAIQKVYFEGDFNLLEKRRKKFKTEMSQMKELLSALNILQDDTAAKIDSLLGKI